MPGLMHAFVQRLATTASSAMGRGSLGGARLMLHIAFSMSKEDEDRQAIAAAGVVLDHVNAPAPLEEYPPVSLFVFDPHDCGSIVHD